MYSIEKEEGYPLAIFDSYMAMLSGSVDSNQYRRLYVNGGGGIIDIIGDGDLACALFVSSILMHFRLMQGGMHTTVDWTIKDLALDSGWYEIDTVVPGSVIVWAEKICTDGMNHRHIGFFMGDDKAISNDAKKRTPQLHHYTFGEQEGKPLRKIEALYFHRDLEK